MKNILHIIKNMRYWLLAFLLIWIVDTSLVSQMDPYLMIIVISIGINIILSVSLNLINGHTGQFSMGHAGFMSVGAYSATIMTKYVFQVVALNTVLDRVEFLGSILIGGVLAALTGLIVGMPSLRLKGDYLAIVTLGFGEIIRVVLLNIPAVGGPIGINGIPNLATLGWTYSFALLTVFVCWRLIHNSYGRAFLAVREDEIAARSVGVPTTESKVKAFVIGAFFAGVAGGLFAHLLQTISPALFDFNRSFEVIIMVVLGGMGSISGSVIAAIILTALREKLRDAGDDVRMIIYSLSLILIMLTRPNGLFGRHELVDLIKAYFRKSPEKKEIA